MSPTFLDMYPPGENLDDTLGSPAGVCGGGGAPVSGLADAQNTGGLVDAMAERFAEADARRMRLLNDAVKRGLNQVEEETMPNGKRAGCPECGSPSRHKLGCSRPGRAGAGAVEEVMVAPRRPRSAAAGDRLEQLSVEELVELRGQVDAELRGRLARLEQERSILRNAVGHDADPAQGSTEPRAA